MKKKLKLVKSATTKPAAAGSTRTGAKVEKTKSGKGSNGGGVGRHVGRTSGLSITKFQNKTILENTKHRRSDEEIAKMWRNEFPNAKAEYTEATVRGVRSLVNKGKHGNDAPKSPVPEYIDGEAQPFWGEKTAAKRAASGEKKSGSGGAKKTLKKKSKK